ncbi:hypothetical protein Glove_345g4 [Diversispora epigaea]|uniref:Uncharacterized protein n=1 Tax=Diversispora epigaea TaxID=1348612 RepID=A0A397HG77_9GLOM|nr:hypothetical protein Glove_345g4 [Diversispora epigaea]
MFGLALVPPIESYVFRVHNKMWAGTHGMLDVSVDGSGGSYAPNDFHVDVSDQTKTFNLEFSVEASTESVKKRGPFTNDWDYCWKFSGSIDEWDIDQC